MNKMLTTSPPHPIKNIISGAEIDVLFINPPSIPYSYLVNGLSDPHTTIHQNIAMPMGLLYLAAMLDKRFPLIQIKLIDLAKSLCDLSKSETRQSMTIEELTNFSLDDLPIEFKPTFVGISILFSTAHKSSLHIASAVKKKWPDVPVIIGGMHATNAVESLLECPSVDYVCRGEGEAIISELTTLLVEGKDVEVLPGIVGRKKIASEKNITSYGSAPLIDNLDDIPFPAWHLLPMEQYIASDDSRAKQLDKAGEHPRMATIISTRGCPFHCTFCSSWTVHGRRMRFRSLENVLEEMTILRERFAVNIIAPEDDLFTVKKERIIPLCDAVAAKFDKTISFQFPSGLSVATLDQDVIHAMVNMGMHVANIAIESGSEYVQKHLIKKNCNLERARKVVQACRDEGIFVRAYFVMGFPGETKEMIQETISFMTALPSDWNVINIACPLIGSEMYNQMMTAGWIDEKFNWDTAFFNERTFDTPEITAAELKELAYDANIKTNFFENYNLRIGEYDRAVNFFSDVLRSHKGHLISQYCIGLCQKGKGDFTAYNASISKCIMMIEAGWDMPKQQLAHYGVFMPELKEISITVLVQRELENSDV